MTSPGRGRFVMVGGVPGAEAMVPLRLPPGVGFPRRRRADTLIARNSSDFFLSFFLFFSFLLQIK